MYTYRGTQCLNRFSKWKTISQCKRTPKMKCSAVFLLPSYPHPLYQNLNARYVFLTSKRPLGNGPLSSWGRLYCELHSRRKVVLFFHIQEFVNRKTRLASLFHGLVWVHSGKCSTYPQSTQNKCPGEYDSQHFVFLGPSRWSYLSRTIWGHCSVYSSGKVLSNKGEDKEMDEEGEEELKEVPESVGTFLWSLLTSSKHGFIFQVSLSTQHKPDL